ncbi:MAG: HdeD family acid-resistance protein [Leptolyngbyaceae cyanobacterium SM1_3_5]|nr:HdeD family acid-resistance protein [Leptolyngbyaceae cyanobacterium SM1_3_5]
MTANTSPSLNNQESKSLWTGVLLIGLGVVAIALPIFSTLVAETWISFILISAGSAKLFYAFQTRNQGGFIWKLLLSILYIGAGIMLFTQPLQGILTLTLLLGSFLLTEGTFELILAFRLRPQQSWTSVLVNGIITLFLGAIIWFQWPSNAPWLLGTAIGASIISTGVSRVLLSLNGNTTMASANANPSDQVTSA